MAKKEKPQPADEPAPVSTEGPQTDAAAEAYQPLFPIVGIGASAGGLEAATQLLQALPADTGMGFVLVQHLSPGRASMLSQILDRSCSMPVAEVQGKTVVEPNRVYVIPPGLDMCMERGALELVPRSVERGHRRPIDQFFVSLAEEQAHAAIGVVLSGTGNDGSEGVKAIKAAGGITFAQDSSAQQESMPQSAAATGCIDFVLAPEVIAHELIRVAQHPITRLTTTDSLENAGLDRIIRRLSRATGVDFTRYKSSTLGRRVARRMLLNKRDTFDEYELLLQHRPEELGALYEDVLIHVTRFFRDPEVFKVLTEQALPRLCRERSVRDPLRIWVLGCSTGEEAYSLAITCAEYAELEGLELAVQVFASDLSSRMIDKARAGIYPSSIAKDVSPERLARFFTAESDHYRVNRTIRDACVFAPHNALADPPFSRMDLVSCRNFLIYLDADLQQQILPVLHYALNPGGILLLGKSETTGASRDLFDAVDERLRIYSRKDGTTARLTRGQFPARTRSSSVARPPVSAGARGPVGVAELQQDARRILAERYAPPGVLIGADLEILQFWGDTGPYLAPLPGKATLNILRMARPGLLVGLRTAIRQARTGERPVRQENLRVRSDGGSRAVNIEVTPVTGGSHGSAGFLILFEEIASNSAVAQPPRGGVPAEGAEGRGDTLALENLRLTRELAGVRDHLQATIEQEQSVNEELQSANEEAQSSNEELQSINEELETSKEEIQSINEELSTVNDELQQRIRDLQSANNDWYNLLESVEVPIIILKPDLRIRRYSPKASEVLRLMPADVGRHISDVNLIRSVDLHPPVREVIESQIAQELEVELDGRWYILRVRPYHTLDKKIDGAVMVFLEVDRLMRAHTYVETIVSTVREPLLVLDDEMRVRTAGRSYLETFRVTAEETEGRSFFELGNGQWDIAELRTLLEGVMREGRTIEEFLVEASFDQIGRRSLRINARRLPGEPGAAPQVLIGMEDITAREAFEAVLRRRADELASADRAKNEFLAMLGHELRNPLAPVLFANEILTRHLASEPALVRQCDLIERQMRQMSRLLDDLLEASKATRGMVSLNRAPVDMAALVADTVNAAALVFRLREQELTCRGPSQPLFVSGDAVRLEQIVTNILNNASKYTPTGGRITVTLEQEAEEAVLRVADTGVGIAPELLPRIFELFTQGERGLDRSQGGLGIGLALVNSLVTLHGGSVQAVSEGPGLGSEFVVRLPLASEQVSPRLEGGAPAKSGKPPVAGAAFVGGRVLVVDDNRDSADTLVELGELWGYEVRAEYDGPRALAAALEYRPDLVILDIGLPGMSGYDVARRLREEESLDGVRLIAFTGYGRSEDQERALEAGFDRHMAKPVDPRVLEKLLAELLQSPRD